MASANLRGIRVAILATDGFEQTECLSHDRLWMTRA